LTRDGALKFLQKLALDHHMEVQVLDVAVAEGSLCCFTHWRVVLRPKWLKAAADEDMNPEVVGAAAAGKAVAEAVRRSRAAAAGVETAVAGIEEAASATAAAAAAVTASSSSSSKPELGEGAGDFQNTRGGAESSASALGERAVGKGPRAVPSVTDTPHPTPEATGSSSSRIWERDAAGAAGEAVADQGPATPTAAAVAVEVPVSRAPAESSGQEYVVEGMEVDVFNDELQLHDIWLFRGPLAMEQRLFLSGRRSTGSVAAEQAQAEEEQERLLEVRGWSMAGDG
jgi:hypothetical protein